MHLIVTDLHDLSSNLRVDLSYIGGKLLSGLQGLNIY